MNSDNSSPQPAPSGPWYRELNSYHWFVLIVAALGWLFDCMDQRIFIVTRQRAVTELLGYRYEGKELVKLDGTKLSESDRKAGEDEIDKNNGLAMMIFMIGWATGGLIFGITGDRWGRARTMLITILIYSAFTGLTALATSTWDFMIYRFITGMGVGGEFAAGVTLLAEVMPPHARPYAIGSLQALSAFGNISGSLLSWVVSSWRYLFLVGIVPALLVIVVRRRLKEPEAWQKAHEERLAGGGTPPGGTLGEIFSDSRWRYNTIIGVLLALSGVIGLWGVGFWTPDLITRTLRAQGVDGDNINRVRAVGTALQDVGAFFGIYIFSLAAARIGRRWAFAMAFVLALAATSFVFGNLSGESDVYWMLPLLGFCNLMVFGGYAIYFPELYPTRLRSTGTGFCYNVARYLAAFGPFTLGYLVIMYRDMLQADSASIKPFQYATLTVGLIYLLGLAVLPFAPETKGKPLPEG